MRFDNINKKAKIILQFFAVSVFSLGLVLGLFWLFMGRRSSSSATSPGATDPERSMAAVPLQGSADSALARQAAELEDFDQRLGQMADSATASTFQMEEAQHAVRNAETRFRILLDLLEAHGQGSAPLVASFRSMLNGHDALTHLQLMTAPAGAASTGTATTKNTPPPNTAVLNATAQNELRHTKIELMTKDDKISELEGLLKAHSFGDKDNSAAAQRLSMSQLQSDNTTLRQQLESQETNMATLKTQFAALKQTNENLQSRKDQDRTSAADEASQKTGAENNEKLQRQAVELADELRFAQVDCNLSRADAQEVIYNSKQRRELLADALTTLNTLARSQDQEIQKKAREKMIRLRAIASTMHD